MPELKHRQGDLIQNRYEVRRLLGSGAFGTVYGCRDREIDLPFAVKEMHVLDEHGGERAAALAQFRAEAVHLSKLRHPHIVSGHYEPFAGDWRVCPVCGLDFGGQSRCPEHGAALLAVASRHYLVMEYLAGPDLLGLAEQNGGVIGWEVLERYARHIAAALSFIHARGLVHRDIKPENARLRADSDDAVLLDFGIATAGEIAGDRYGTRARRHTSGGGTFGYAPDAPRERQNPDARSDVHAFGMTLYHLLTGRDPTEPDDLRLLRAHHLRDFEPQLPPALDSLIQECIAPDPDARPQNGAEVLARLENLSAPLNAAPQRAPSVAAPTQPVAPQPPEIEPLIYRSGERARDVAQLLPLLDARADESARRFSGGDIEGWLAAIGERELAQKAREIRLRYAARPRQGLELLAQALGSPRPVLQAEPPALDFGGLNPDAQKTIDLRLKNGGRGHLFGLVRATHPAVSTYGEWDGNRAKIPVTFDANRLRPGKYRGELALDSSAGEFAVPFEAQVRGPSWLAPFLVTLFYGAGGVAAGGLLRALPFSLNGAPVLHWLSVNTGLLSWQTSATFGAVLAAITFVWFTLEALTRRSCSLWLSLGTLGTVGAVAAAFLGNDLLRSGDAHLLQLFGGPRVPPEIGWMFAGGLGGALLGSLRRWKDVASLRVIAVAAAWLATLALVYAAWLGVHPARF